MGIAQLLGPKKSLREYMAQYKAEHTHLGTKLTHMVGIPMIVASVPTFVIAPPVGGALFAGGWALQLIGHAVFEKKKPSFLSDPFYLVVGAVWVGVEWAELAGLPIPEALTPALPVEEAVSHVPVGREAVSASAPS